MRVSTDEYRALVALRRVIGRWFDLDAVAHRAARLTREIAERIAGLFQAGAHSTPIPRSSSTTAASNRSGSSNGTLCAELSNQRSFLVGARSVSR